MDDKMTDDALSTLKLLRTGPTLARMEHIGVGIDVPELQRLSDRLVSECDRLRGLIVEDAGHDFNVNSTKQLREVLFVPVEGKPVPFGSRRFGTPLVWRADHTERVALERDYERLALRIARGELASLSAHEGEAMQVEYSCKYSLEDFAALAHRAGLEVRNVWLDPEEMFSVQYLVREGAAS